jgi:hypothetical protein
MLRLITDASRRATVDHITDPLGGEERDSTQELLSVSQLSRTPGRQRPR